MKLKRNVKLELVALQAGMTVTTWSDEHYGYLQIDGVSEEKGGRAFRLILSSYSDLPILSDALRRLEGSP